MILGCLRTYSNIFWSILTNDGMWAPTCMLGGESPQLLFMRGSAPQTPHILLYCYFWAPKKDAEWKKCIHKWSNVVLISDGELIHDQNVAWNLDTITYQVPGIKYFVPSTWYQALATSVLVPSIWYQVLGTIGPSTWYQVLGTKYLVPSIWYQVICTK